MKCGSAGNMLQQDAVAGLVGQPSWKRCKAHCLEAVLWVRWFAKHGATHVCDA